MKASAIAIAPKSEHISYKNDLYNYYLINKDCNCITITGDK